MVTPRGQTSNGENGTERVKRRTKRSSISSDRRGRREDQRQKEGETGRLEATLSSSAVEESRGMREWLEGNPGTARASETGAITEPLVLVGTAHGTALSAGPPKSLQNCTSFYCKCLKSYERFCRRNSLL